MKGKFTFGIALFALTLFAAIPAFAGSPTGTAALSWTAPTTNTDGTVCTDLAGYNVYLHSGTLYSKLTSTTATSWTDDNISVPNNTVLKRCYAVTAFDTSGNESGYSNEVCKSFFGVDTISPSPPGDAAVK